MKDLKPGDIVRFKIIDNQFSSEGFSLGGIIDCKKDELVIYQEIDIEDYPSFRDFKGQKTTVKHNNFGIVLKKIGRPYRLSLDATWSCYDVYEVLTIKLSKRQVFRASIEKVL